ncbi:ROK family protein [Candidatus Saccharibacteria bacterium]|nr:ROK family protein [Candidatus Saccharibacteria bacterium]
MYLGIDVGGTKTLLAVFDENGQISRQAKFPTPPDYENFLQELKKTLAEFKDFQIKACCCALPGRLDRSRGIGVRFGNLGWQNIPIKQDVSRLLGLDYVFIENDAKLAGLYEAINHKEYKKVVYVTIGTGIGIGIITNGNIVPELADSEIGNMLINHNGSLQKWEAFASGKAFQERFGLKASEANNPTIWERYTDDLVVGFDAALAAFQPDVVIIGGGVGAHFDKFGSLLAEKIAKIRNRMVPIPPIIKAAKPEEAVIYGCYVFLRQKLGI